MDLLKYYKVQSGNSKIRSKWSNLMLLWAHLPLFLQLSIGICKGVLKNEILMGVGLNINRASNSLVEQPWQVSAHTMTVVLIHFQTIFINVWASKITQIIQGLASKLQDWVKKIWNFHMVFHQIEKKERKFCHIKFFHFVKMKNVWACKITQIIQGLASKLHN